jgi:hypothetical protein
VGRITISFTSTSGGCSIANAIARAIASGGIANFSLEAVSCAFTSGFVTSSAKFVLTGPGEITVTRSLSPASWRNPSETARKGEPQACHKWKPECHESLCRNRFSNFRALSTSFTTLRLHTHAGVLLLPLPR